MGWKEGDSRHQRSCQSLEEKCDGAGCATKEATDAADKGNEAEEESAHGEEKTDEDEGEHEATFEVVFGSPAATPSQFPLFFPVYGYLDRIYPKMSSVPKFLLGSNG